MTSGSKQQLRTRRRAVKEGFTALDPARVRQAIGSRDLQAVATAARLRKAQLLNVLNGGALAKDASAALAKALEVPEHSLRPAAQSCEEELRSLLQDDLTPAQLLSTEHLRRPQIPLQDIFVPLSVTREMDGGVHRKVAFAELTSRLASRESSGSKRPIRAILMGSPGSGKSTYLQALALELTQPTSEVLPIRVQLDGFTARVLGDGRASRTCLQDLVSRRVHQLASPDLRASCDLDELLNQAATAGRLALFLDSLDMIGGDDARVRLRRELEHIDDWGPVQVVIATRTTGYEQRLDEFEHYRMDPFEHEDLQVFATKCGAVLKPQPEARRIDVRSTLAAAPRDLTRSPFFATLIALQPGLSEGHVVDRVGILETALRAALSRHQGAPADCSPAWQRRYLADVALAMHSAFADDQKPRRVPHSSFVDMLTTSIARSRLFGEPSPRVSAEGLTQLLLQAPGLLERTPGQGASPAEISWAHDSYVEFLAAEALALREIDSRGIDGLADFVVSRVKIPGWREVLLFVVAQNLTNTSLTEKVVQRLLHEHSWQALSFIIAMRKEDARARLGAEYFDDLWEAAQIQQPHALATLRQDLRGIAAPARPIPDLAVWIFEKLRTLPAAKLESFVRLFTPEDSGIPEVVRDRAIAQPSVRAVLERLWPTYDWVASVPGTLEASASTESRVELIAPRCVVCLSRRWADGAARSALENLRRIGWISGVMSLAASGDTTVPAELVIDERSNRKPVRIAPALVAEQPVPPQLPGEFSASDADLLKALTEILDQDFSAECARAMRFPDAARIVHTFVESARQHFPARLAQEAHRGGGKEGDFPARMKAAIGQNARNAEDRFCIPEYAHHLEWLAKETTIIASKTPLRHPPCREQAPSPWSGLDGNRSTAQSRFLPVYGRHVADALVGAIVGSLPSVRALPSPDGKKRPLAPSMTIAALRAQNRWLALFFEPLASRATNGDEYVALLLSLGLAQYQTTWSWPWGSSWASWFGPKAEPPRGWLSRFFWHLCRAAGDPSKTGMHLQDAERCLKRPDAGPPAFVEALWSARVRPINPTELARYR